MIKVSVILCTHNPRQVYLERTLVGLRAQTLPLEQWELILVDNGSRDSVAARFDLSWHVNGRHVVEPKLGLTPARLRGIRESAGGVLVFVDDDNVLAPDYLEVAHALFLSRPDLGCFGAARILPVFEEEPAPGLEPFTRCLALRDEDEDMCPSVPEDWSYPWGAGLVVRREVAVAYVKDVEASELKMQLDRRGSALNSCGDDEFSWVAIGMGLQRGVFRSLVVQHLIAAHRVQKDYLLALHESFGYSRALLLHTHGRKVLPPAPVDVGLTGRIRAVARSFAVGRFGEGLRSMRAPVVRKEMGGLDREFDMARRNGLVRFLRTHTERAS